MDVTSHLQDVHRQLAAAADAAGMGEADRERLSASLDAAMRLALQDALVAAAEEMTVELAPGSVELRLRGRDIEFVVTQPASPDEEAEPELEPRSASEGDEAQTARISLRLTEQLKTRVEEAASKAGVSVNTWLVRTAGAAAERSVAPHHRRSPRGSQRYTGWVS